MAMEVTFDPAKDEANTAKHGVSLAAAEMMDWDDAWIELDDRRDYGEVREIGLVPMNDRLYCVVFTRRANGLRIISLRKANQREFDDYVSKTDTTH